MAYVKNINGYDIKDAEARDDITSINSDINDLKDVDTFLLSNTLKNKKVIVLGDSLTLGNPSDGTQGKTWLDLLKSKYNLDLKNYSISGSKISTGGTGQTGNDMSLRIDNILADNDTCDIFILSGGANDKNQNVPLGSINSATNDQFIGAIKNIIVKVKRKYKDKCKMLCMTTYHRYDTINDAGNSESDYVNGMIRACDLLSVPCFNSYNNSGISLADSVYTNPPYAWADSGLARGTTSSHHFSVDAHKYLASVYEHLLTNMYVNNIGEQYTQVAGDTGEIWTKQRTNNGMTLITCRKVMNNVSFTRYSDSVLWNTSTIVITPPSNLIGDHTSILSCNVNVASSGYTIASINNNPSNTRIGVNATKISASEVPAQSLTFYIQLLVVGA